jgi:hypothetical protein
VCADIVRLGADRVGPEHVRELVGCAQTRSTIVAIP